MKRVSRELGRLVLDAAKHYPAVVLTGPRRAGKTTLFRHLFPKAQYVLLEDPDVQARAENDPRGFLNSLRPPVIFDEVQNTPRIFNYVRSLIDGSPQSMGQWLFTGSQEAPLMEGVSESMAGRAAILQLLPFSVVETNKVNLLYGGFPEVVARPKGRELWFSSYLQTYLERDVRLITQVRDLGVFRRFLSLLAVRHGQLLNRTDIAGPLGVSVPTINEWLHILEITSQIILLQPYFENYGKRLIKSPKVYWGDSGLACHLLGINTQAELDRSPFLGPLYEGYIASEILKSQTNAGRRKELYYFRDQQGLEVDFLVPQAGGEVWLVECKAGRTVQPSMAKPVQALRTAMGSRASRSFVVHRKAQTGVETSAIARGVEAVSDEQFIQMVNQPKKRAAGRR